MGGVTTFCMISGSTPEVPSNLLYIHSYGPVVTAAFNALANPEELASQDDLCLIGPIHPSGQHFEDGPIDGIRDISHPIPRARDLLPERDVRILPHCVMGDSWLVGIVDAPPVNNTTQAYLVSRGCTFMVLTYALDILALVSGGRMTPLRFWHLMILQGFEIVVRPSYIEGVEYGEVSRCWDAEPEEFPAYTVEQIKELEQLGDVEIVKQRLIDEGLFWLWMAPDRFPIDPTIHDTPPTLIDAALCEGQSMIENIPADVLVPIISYIPLASVFKLARTSQTMRTRILGNGYLACVWLYHNAPWWVPVPTHTPCEAGSRKSPIFPHPATQLLANTTTSIPFPARLDWMYIKRCLRSGSMRNRKRIWTAAVGIERVADLSGV